jgi:PBP1b-binding outer membrane lipoprotein LpoB
MKRIIFVVIMAFIMSGCLASWSNTVTVTDTKGQVYNISSMYDAVKKEVSVSIITNGVEYKCEAIKDANYSSNVAFTTDFNVFDLTGGFSISYNGINYTCEAK